MPLKVIGAGFGRTGTNSLQHALQQLGYPCYHMIEVLENPANKDHGSWWRAVSHAPAGSQHDWEHVFARYTAAVDNPACCVWRELVAAYPDAKVVLSVHPAGPDAWFDSTHATIYRISHQWQFKVLELLTPFGRTFGDMSERLIWQRAHRGTIRDRAKAIAFYHQHIDEVKAAVPADRLLVFSVKDGWKPLCDFLGVPVPATPFPNVNDREEFQARIRNIQKGAYVMLGLVAAAVAALAFGISRLIG